MHCPNCSTENRPTANFCDHCGTPLAVTCPNCQTPNRPAANFCDHCGTALSKRPTLPPTPAPERPAEEPAPSGWVEKLEAARATQAMVGERRVVTMLFCDVTGSTAAAEKLDPEEWREIINGAFKYMIDPVYRYEGTLARLMGDAILAFFGAPIAHEDDPQRAVLTGLEIVRGITPYWEQIEARWGIRMNVRVGINTGLVVVGAVGSDLKMEYTAMGDAINLAARMEQTAEPGTVQVSENTHRLTEPLFTWEALGEQSVKGKSGAVRVFRPTGKRAQPGRLRGVSGLQSTLIGRDAELESFAGAIQRVRLGRGGILFITGEAGLGKTRMLREGRRIWSEDPSEHPDSEQHWIFRQATSFDTIQAYSLLRGFLRSVCRLEESAKPEIVREHVATWTTRLGMDPDKTAALEQAAYRVITGETPGDAGAAREREAFKAQVFTSLGDYLHHHYKDTPGTIIIDDLHWADAASIELLEFLSSSVEQLPLLFVFALRPELDSSGWGLRTRLANQLPHRFTEITLHTLDRANSDALIDALLPDNDLPEHVRTQVHARAEGNPFFIEEILRTFIESGALNEQAGSWHFSKTLERIEVPDNIESLLAARIDRLSREARDILQSAAVIGRTFQHAVLRQMDGLDVPLDKSLAELERARMIEEAARQPEIEYRFRNALTQEIVFRSILRSRRKVLHEQIGRTLETMYPGRQRELATVLAVHFEEAGRTAKAIHYHLSAGETALQLFAVIEALSHYGQVIELAETASEDAELISPEQLRDAYLKKGRAQELASQFEAANQTYLAMEAAAEKSGDRSMALAAIVRQAVLHCTPTILYSLPEGRRLIDRALALAEALDDPEATARTKWAEVNLNRLSGRLETAAELGREGLAIATQNNYVELIGYLNHDLGYVLAELGRPDDSIAAFNRAAEIWEELGNLPLLADGLSGNILNLSLYADYDQAIENADRALRISEQTNNIWGKSFSRMYLGAVYRDLGRYGDAIEAAEFSIREGIRAGFMVPRPLCAHQLTHIYLDLGDLEAAAQAAERAEAASNELNVPEMRILGPLARLSVWVAQGIYEEVIERIEQTRAQLSENEILFYYYSGFSSIRARIGLGDFSAALAECAAWQNGLEGLNYLAFEGEVHYLRALALLGQEKFTEAGQFLEEAAQLTLQANQRRLLWKILAEQARLADRTGDSESAHRLRRQAADVIQYILEHTPSKQRGAFKTLPLVTEVLAHV